jgi:uncharacterized SAM-binding protein YcdF (DUF218 family)
MVWFDAIAGVAIFFKFTVMKRNAYLLKMKGLFFKAANYFLVIMGIVASVLLLLSFTDVPYHAYAYLGITDNRFTKDPEVIVVMGGDGMPSPDGLMRTYYAAKAAHKYKDAAIILALPATMLDTLYQLRLLRQELMLRGVDSVRISFEPNGYNTHAQAVNIRAMYPEKKTPVLLLITSPEHMYRSMHTFRKVGFAEVGGISAFEKPIDEENVKDKGGKKEVRVESLALRYNMWSYLRYELMVLREYCAICYYKTKGWI